jgi:hypothetical protein
MLDYSLLLIFFSFAVGGFHLPRGCAGLCSWRVGRELWVVCDAHLFILQIHASNFEAS